MIGFSRSQVVASFPGHFGWGAELAAPSPASFTAENDRTRAHRSCAGGSEFRPNHFARPVPRSLDPDWHAGSAPHSSPGSIATDRESSLTPTLSPLRREREIRGRRSLTRP